MPEKNPERRQRKTPEEIRQRLNEIEKEQVAIEGQLEALEQNLNLATSGKAGEWGGDVLKLSNRYKVLDKEKAELISQME